MKHLLGKTRTAALAAALSVAPVTTALAQDTTSPWDFLFQYGLSLLINDPVKGRRSPTGILRCVVGDASAVDITYMRVFAPTAPGGLNQALATCRALQQRWNDEHPIPQIILNPVILGPPSPAPGSPVETPVAQSGPGTIVKVVEFITGVTPPSNETTVATVCAVSAICLSMYGGPKRPLAALAGRGWAPARRLAAGALARLRGTRSTVAAEDALRRIAADVHSLADKIRKRNSAVVVAEVRLTDGTVELWAAGSSGQLTKTQKRMLGKTVSRIVGGKWHAEQNIAAVLPEGATVERWGISWGERQKSVPCRSCAPMVEHIGGTVEGASR